MEGVHLAYLTLLSLPYYIIFVFLCVNESQKRSPFSAPSPCLKADSIVAFLRNWADSYGQNMPNNDNISSMRQTRGYTDDTTTV